MATDEELIKSWYVEDDFNIRNNILQALKERNLFPTKYIDESENDGALYPDIADPLFIQKLLHKREFAENKQKSLAELIEEGDNPCDTDNEFELSPVQRFIGQFMSPRTPYNSALLYHGVGVGKTCAAITVAESFLELFPRNNVIIIAPPNIQPGFERNIFNENNLIIGENNEPNQFKGCK